MTKEEIIDLFEYFLRDMGIRTRYYQHKAYKTRDSRSFISGAFTWGYMSRSTVFWRRIHEQWLSCLREHGVI